MNHPEDTIQRMLFQWITLATPRIPRLALAFHPANGGYRNKIEAARLKGLGVRSGVPDVILPCRGRDPSYIGLAIELKSPKGRVSDAQQEWGRRLVSAGWYWTVARSFDEARATICDYLGERA